MIARLKSNGTIVELKNGFFVAKRIIDANHLRGGSTVLCRQTRSKEKRDTGARRECLLLHDIGIAIQVLRDRKDKIALGLVKVADAKGTVASLDVGSGRDDGRIFKGLVRNVLGPVESRPDANFLVVESHACRTCLYTKSILLRVSRLAVLDTVSDTIIRMIADGTPELRQTCTNGLQSRHLFEGSR